MAFTQIQRNTTPVQLIEANPVIRNDLPMSGANTLASFTADPGNTTQGDGANTKVYLPDVTAYDEYAEWNVRVPPNNSYGVGAGVTHLGLLMSAEQLDNNPPQISLDCSILAFGASTGGGGGPSYQPVVTLNSGVAGGSGSSYFIFAGSGYFRFSTSLAGIPLMDLTKTYRLTVSNSSNTSTLPNGMIEGPVTQAGSGTTRDITITSPSAMTAIWGQSNIVSGVTCDILIEEMVSAGDSVAVPQGMHIRPFVSQMAVAPTSAGDVRNVMRQGRYLSAVGADNLDFHADIRVNFLRAALNRDASSQDRPLVVGVQLFSATAHAALGWEINMSLQKYISRIHSNKPGRG